MSSPQNPVPVFHLSAFSKKPFAGNPAAVVLLEQERDTLWMQNIAAEMNLSETAFTYPDNGQLRLRWFTPAVEVDLCGHATIATAFVLRQLAQEGNLPGYLAPFWKNGCVQFISRSGVLTAEQSVDGMTLDFPATQVKPAEVPDGLLDALGVTAADVRFCGQSRFDYLLHVATADIVRGLTPTMNLLAKLPVRGIIVTSLGDTADHDIISRFFAPAAGVDEDPVTGSAHCALAPYWAPEFGRSTLFGFQASHRGGHVRMELVGDRVRLSGGAVLVSRGELIV